MENAKELFEQAVRCADKGNIEWDERLDSRVHPSEVRNALLNPLTYAFIEFSRIRINGKSKGDKWIDVEITVRANGSILVHRAVRSK